MARSPHPLFGYQFLSLEHWGNAVAQAEVGAHNMISPGERRRPHPWTPYFWSAQFGVNIKSVGVPNMADQILVRARDGAGLRGRRGRGWPRGR
ncbi:hypothetical protein GCM10022420_000570 [Streptomyces iranensis]|uniref:NADPH-dependent 2,4-dienoyl-CoA reductase/sulfur reductase-like enzyme n=1 Tax=Streptomyces iranensis TaxID=576784 RepID=A0ABS4N4A5_9ACTN|nr:NADPH-dependent 2,4-dienoyl-CoA reductase/sulfur reductase-like enzyme [Streptomyces iranensis]